MSALDLSLEDLIKQRAKPAQKTAKAKPRRAAARGGKKTVVRKKTAGKRPRDARGSIFDRLGNADGAKTVEVRNVPYDVLESELRRLFEACGTIKACRMALDASGRSLGRATITFANPREAQAARTRYDGETLDGRALEVRLATARPGELVVAGGVPADEGEVGGVAVLRIGDAVSCIAEAPLDLARAYPVHAAAAFSGDGVVVFGGGVPCLSFAPVFGDSVRVVMT